MSLSNETFIYILKQYLKGKKDSIGIILLSLKEFILEKYKSYNLKEEEMTLLIKIIIQGIDTYSFEKAISFYDYINLYVDIALNLDKEYIEDFNYNDEFIEFLLINLKQSIEESKINKFNLY
jgi:hypothetical protein